MYVMNRHYYLTHSEETCTAQQIASRHITSHHRTSHPVTSHRIASHHITSHRIPPRSVSQHVMSMCCMLPSLQCCPYAMCVRVCVCFVCGTCWCECLCVDMCDACECDESADEEERRHEAMGERMTRCEYTRQNTDSKDQRSARGSSSSQFMQHVIHACAKQQALYQPLQQGATPSSSTTTTTQRNNVAQSLRHAHTHTRRIQLAADNNRYAAHPLFCHVFHVFLVCVTHIPPLHLFHRCRVCIGCGLYDTTIRWHVLRLSGNTFRS